MIGLEKNHLSRNRKLNIRQPYLQKNVPYTFLQCFLVIRNGHLGQGELKVYNKGRWAHISVKSSCMKRPADKNAISKIPFWA